MSVPAPSHRPSVAHPARCAPAAGVPLAAERVVALSEPQEVWHFSLGAPPDKSDVKTVDVEFTRWVCAWGVGRKARLVCRGPERVLCAACRSALPGHILRPPMQAR